jgi:hypothetical protein
MSAPIYGKGLLPGTGGLVDFKTIEKKASPNEYLVAPEGSCPRFKGSSTSGGGGGGGSRGLAPVFEGLTAAQLEELFLKTIQELYTLQVSLVGTMLHPPTHTLPFGTDVANHTFELKLSFNDMLTFLDLILLAF